MPTQPMPPMGASPGLPGACFRWACTGTRPGTAPPIRASLLSRQHHGRRRPWHGPRPRPNGGMYRLCKGRNLPGPNLVLWGNKRCALQSPWGEYTTREACSHTCAPFATECTTADSPALHGPAKPSGRFTHQRGIGRRRSPDGDTTPVAWRGGGGGQDLRALPTAVWDARAGDVSLDPVHWQCRHEHWTAGPGCYSG